MNEEYYTCKYCLQPPRIGGVMNKDYPVIEHDCSVKGVSVKIHGASKEEARDYWNSLNERPY